MNERFGTLPTDVRAAIGPGIGSCCYEVGLEVAQQFGLQRAGYIDLAAANRDQLIAAGLPRGGIEIVGGCTRCDASKFHSFRRDREQSGRMVSFIAIAKAR
jgi:copper oxidase (laccase) domain-containing protein